MSEQFDDRIIEERPTTERPGPKTRSIPFSEFHRLPGDDASRESVLSQGGLITKVRLPKNVFADRSCFLKVRDLPITPGKLL